MPMVRPDAYYLTLLPRMLRLGKDLKQFAEDRSQEVSDTAIRCQLNDITDSASHTPMQDMETWCKQIEKTIKAKAESMPNKGMAMELRDRMIGGPYGGQDIIVRDLRRSFVIERPEPEEFPLDIDLVTATFKVIREVYWRAEIWVDGVNLVFWLHDSVKDKKLVPMSPESWLDIAKASPWPAERCHVIGLA